MADLTPPRTPGRQAADPRVLEALDVLDASARSIARQLGGRFTIDDLRGYGHEAISEVIGRFDPSRGVSFRSYARLRLRGAIIDGLRREDGLPRGVLGRIRALEASDLYVQEKAEENGAARPASAAAADARVATFLRGVATAYATGLIAKGDDDVTPGEGPERDGPEEHARRRQARALLDRALTEIGDPEGTILRRHYFHDEDLQDAAAHLGLSKSWGSRLHARGLEKLAERLQALRSEL